LIAMPHATPPPLCLTDLELVSIIALTTPLPQVRDQFLQALAAVLQGRELGPGTIHGAARALQQKFLADSPQVPRHLPRWSSRRRSGVREEGIDR
jgi:hypothetical protein